MALRYLLDAEEQERDFLMLPDNFDFAMLPEGFKKGTLKELGMLESNIETIDYAIHSWLTVDLDLSTYSNEGFKKVPVIWQSPERAFQVKNEKDLRDDGGSLKLPIVSIERTAITKDPARKGGFQAHLYSSDKNGRTGRMVLAKRIKEDKTRNFAVAGTTRNDLGLKKQLNSKRVNKKIVIQSLSIPIPIYVNIDYKITIKSEYQQQMNELMTPFITRTGQINSFVMRRNGHLYEAFIEQSFAHNNNVATMGEDSRMFSSEITIKVLGYLIGEGNNDDRPIVRVDENVVEVTYPSESGPVPGNDGFFDQ